MTVSLSSNCVCIQGVVQKFPGTRCLSGEEPACQCRRHRRRGFDPWVGKIRLSRKWQPAPVFLPGKFHGQKNLVGYSPWGCKESDTTEHTQASEFLKAYLQEGITAGYIDKLAFETGLGVWVRMQRNRTGRGCFTWRKGTDRLQGPDIRPVSPSYSKTLPCGNLLVLSPLGNDSC